MSCYLAVVWIGSRVVLVFHFGVDRLTCCLVFSCGVDRLTCFSGVYLWSG